MEKLHREFCLNLPNGGLCKADEKMEKKKAGIQEKEARAKEMLQKDTVAEETAEKAKQQAEVKSKAATKAEEKITAEKAEKVADATEKTAKEQLLKDKVAEEKAAKLKVDAERETQTVDSQSVPFLILQANKQKEKYVQSLTDLNSQLMATDSSASQPFSITKVARSR